MEYRIVEHYQRNTVVELVNQAIAEGWVPQGGVCVGIYQDNRPTWVQAMVKPRQCSDIFDY